MHRRRRLPAAKARGPAILRTRLERVVFMTAMAASVGIVIAFAV